jgi:mannose-6-phosphate isomerase-like protein (cupin superfamily)
MDLKNFDNYLKTIDDYELSHLEAHAKAYNFNDINETIKNFDRIKTTTLTPTDLWEIPSFWYSKELSFIKHSRFNPTSNHKHKFIEMAYVYSGEINEVVNDEPLILRKGDLIILDTNVIHSFYIIGFNDIMLNFPIKAEYFNNSIFNQLNSDNVMTNFLLHALYESHKYNSYLVFHTGENEFIHRIICKIAQEFIDPNLNSDVIIDSCIIILFSELLRIYDSEEKNQENSDF